MDAAYMKDAKYQYTTKCGGNLMERGGDFDYGLGWHGKKSLLFDQNQL